MAASTAATSRTIDPASHALLYALGASYNRSRRTFVHGTLAHARNSANGAFALFATPRGTGRATNPAAGASQTGASAGMTHLF